MITHVTAQNTINCILHADVFQNKTFSLFEILLVQIADKMNAINIQICMYTEEYIQLSSSDMNFSIDADTGQ
jgi:hypothetical protein